MTTQTSVCALVTREVSDTIKRRDFDEAVRVGSVHALSKRHTCEDVDFWFHYSLALRLSRRYTAADEAWQAAKLLPGYNQIIEGDFLRDIALMYLREGDPTKALKILLFVEVNHHRDADPNRKILLGALKGRVHDAFSANTQDDELMYYLAHLATRLYSEAEYEWLRLGDDADHQWQMSNLFWWLRLEARFGYTGGFSRDVYSDHYESLLAGEVSRKRRFAAKLLWRLGPVGVKIVDRLA